MNSRAPKTLASSSNKHQPCFYRVSIKGVIQVNGKLLLTREHGSKRWDLPGGGVEHHEDPMDAFSREIQEEIGTDVVHLDLDHLQAWFMYDSDPGWDRPILYLVAHAEIAGVPQAGEGIEIAYFDRNDLVNVLLEKHVEHYRERLIGLASE